MRLICAWGFTTLGLERIELQAAVGNPASQRVAERAGFTREAVLRSRWATFGGERHDMVCLRTAGRRPLRQIRPRRDGDACVGNA